MALPTGGCPVAAGAVAGAVAGGHLLLPPPQRGLRGALTGQKASLGCTLSEVASQASVCALCRVFVQLRRLLAITFKREFPNQRVLRNL